MCTNIYLLRLFVAAKPAVGSPHLNKAGFDEDADLDLADAPQNFTLTLNGESLSIAGETAVSFPINQAHTLELSSDEPFKGFLIRLGPLPSESEFLTDFTMALTPQDGNDANVKVEQTHCIDIENVGGVTHTDSNEKNRVTAMLQMDEPASDMIMDITVVIVNSGETSEFYYSQLLMNAVDPAAPATPAGGSSAATAAPIMGRTTRLWSFLVGVVGAVLFLSQ